jgi:hypothetical protein
VDTQAEEVRKRPSDEVGSGYKVEAREEYIKIKNNGA